MAYFDQRLSTPWWALRIGFGAVPFLAGLDKFFNILTNSTEVREEVGKVTPNFRRQAA